MAVQNTQATVVVPDSGVFSGDMLPMTKGGGVVAAVLLGIQGFMWFRKKYFSDNAEINADQKQSEFLNTVLAERDKAMDDARKAWETRAEDAQQIGKLTAMVQAQDDLIKRLNDEVQALRSQIDMLNTKLDACLKGTP